MKTILIIVSLVVLVLVALAITLVIVLPTNDSESEASPCDVDFEAFTEQYNKVYDSDSEFDKRKEIFCDNKARIDESNAKAKAAGIDATLQINAYSDLTQEEWAESLGIGGASRP